MTSRKTKWLEIKTQEKYIMASDNDSQLTIQERQN